MDIDQISQETDTDRLWEQLKAAKAADDLDRVRALENRMRELSGERRFAHLSDEELARRLSSLEGNREPDDMMAHSPSMWTGSPGDGADTAAFNSAIRANQQDGVEATRQALLDEQRRRAASA